MSSKGRDKSIIYLNLFLLFFILNNLQITLVDFNYLNLNYFERKLLIPFSVLIIPSFYTFVTYYLKAEKKIKSFVILSIVLFFIEIAIRIVFSFKYYQSENSFVIAKYSQIEEIVNLCYTLFLYFRVVNIFLCQAKLYESIASFDNMKWLKKFLVFGFLVLVFWIFAILFNLKEIFSPNIPVYYPLRISSTLIVSWVSYYGFFKYNLLTERIELRKVIIKSKIITFLQTKTDSDFIKIENYILEDKKYLNPLLSVSMISKNIDIPDRNVSNSIFMNTKRNFNDYINHFRIEEAKIILVHPNYSNYTINSIGLECGFYSKATFYRALYNKDNPSETIQVTDGRFDINLATLNR
jgi:AraC-like DNA-binding protein